MTSMYQTPESRLGSILLKCSPVNGCLIWTGSHNGTTYRYPVVYWNNKSYRASRLVWELFKGEKPKKCVLHKCDNWDKFPEATQIIDMSFVKKALEDE